MEIAYQNNLSGNYMILRDFGICEEDSFSVKMLRKHPALPGLLPCRIERINGEQVLYYTITACQSLADILEKGTLTGERMRAMMHSVHTAVTVLQEYLLPVEGLLLCPECMFSNAEGTGFLFCYRPCQDRCLTEDLRDVLDRMLPVINYKDAALVKMTFDIHTALQQDNISLTELERLTETEEAVEDVKISGFFQTETPALQSEPEVPLLEQPQTDARTDMPGQGFGFVQKVRLFVRYMLGDF